MKITVVAKKAKDYAKDFDYRNRLELVEGHEKIETKLVVKDENGKYWQLDLDQIESIITEN